MADDPDVPPLEDMTEVVKKAEAIRESRNGPSQPNGLSKSETQAAKDRAKVVKKPAARVVKPGEELGKGDAASSEKPVEAKKTTPAPAPAPKSSNTGMFGGMKKGFLFGGSGKTSKAISTSSTKNSAAKITTENSKENIPLITPKAKAQSDLTFDEVQQAMSEAKGLLENQDWITNDLLTKIEKNDSLSKRFSDARFMQALEEFQKDPEGAMQKYKGNEDVERFLQEFCGLLGDHFTTIADNPGQQKSQSNASSSPASQNPKHHSQSMPVQSSISSSKPKITEILSDTETIPNATKAPPKIVELTDEKSTSVSSSTNSEKSPNIEELPQKDSSLSSEFSKLKVDSKSSHSQSTTRSGSRRVPDILTYSPGAGADMQEVPAAPLMADEEVKEVLKDQKVMETLMDPKIMNIIQLLRSDPEKAQKIVDSATGDLKEKITLLIMKGLLRFQAS